MIEIPLAYEGISKYRQFILHKDKTPVNAITLFNHDPHDPSAWVTLPEALIAANANPGYEIGFVFTSDDPFFFIDLDKCLIDGKWSNVATEICERFSQCAVEVSRSGTGLHIIGSMNNIPDHGCRNKSQGLEFYTEKRYVALTGVNVIGDCNAIPRPGIMEWLIGEYFPFDESVSDPAKWTTGPSDDWNGPSDDDELIAKMMSSKSAGSVFGANASIQALWAADIKILSNAYPHPDKPFDHSSADAALVAHLTWWTGRDCSRIDRLFRRSKLYREKWEKRQDYRQSTILKSVGNCKTVYAAPVVVINEPLNQPDIATPSHKSGFQYLSPDMQVEYFRNCVYIQMHHRIFTPNGMMLKPEQFKAMYGGCVFALDSGGEKVTKNAWEAFTESQAIAFPKATNIVFRPNSPPGALIKEEGLVLFNNYVPVEIDREIGDHSPFMDLLLKLFPNDRDREIIINYMAACVQLPGEKFQWAPLIQGCEGNGKSLLLTAVSRAVGVRYTHKPPAQDISNIFNAWISGKLFIAVEEVYVDNKREVMDALKTLITDDRVAITPKGVDQSTGDNRANFMCTSNHKNAIRVAKKNNRRWCIFYTPQQSVDDIERDGMSGLYFPSLWKWFKDRGHAIISEYLATYPIADEYNPSTLCHRAPHTSSSDEAVNATLGGIEQEVLEVVDEGRPGFANGWISSMALSTLVNNRRINHTKRSEILNELGYIPHPGLVDGRCTVIIPMEGGKPRLYIRSDNINRLLTNPIEIVSQYVSDQGILDHSVNSD